jgi:hypothetical protein
MDRYNNISITRQLETNIPMYVTVKYPSILLDSSDIYVYTTMGDRYDLLASSFYGDSSLWWIIKSANSNLSSDSLIPPAGIQIRIPSSFRISEIVAEYERIN